MSNFNLHELWASLANGPLRIEDWWRINENAIQINCSLFHLFCEIKEVEVY